MRIQFLALAVALGACASAAAPRSAPAAIETAAPQWLAQHQVASVAIAYIEDGRIAWTAAYGEQSPGVPATVNSLYNVASLAKPVSAETMLRLASQGRVDLDAPMSAHWIDPDIANDPRRDVLTLRVALSHRTGFANWRRMSGGVLAFQSEPGQGFTYSGEGYEYARRATQAATGDFEASAQRLVFGPIGMEQTAYTRRDWFGGRIAVPHDGEGGVNTPSINEPGEGLASDDLYTTVGDYARFVISVMNNEGVSAEIAQQRLQYSTELTEGDCGGLPAEICPRGVGMGLGWMVFHYEGETVVNHSGSDAGEQALAFFIPERRTGVVILTNSASGKKLFPLIVEQLYPNQPYVELLRLQAR